MVQSVAFCTSSCRRILCYILSANFTSILNWRWARTSKEYLNKHSIDAYYVLRRPIYIHTYVRTKTLIFNVCLVMFNCVFYCLITDSGDVRRFADNKHAALLSSPPSLPFLFLCPSFVLPSLFPSIPPPQPSSFLNPLHPH